MHVSVGDRAYIPSVQGYGTVFKTRVFGKEAVVIERDDGSMQAFCGDKILEDVFNKVTGKNGNGESVDIPTDVRVIGPAVLESIGLDEITRAALFQKFMTLDTELRLEKATYWEANRDDPEKMSVFLPELMTLLGEDDVYIATQSQRLLAHLDDDVRKVMMTNLHQRSTSEERAEMIVKYTSVRNDRKRTEIFLQGLYELLLDDTTYITMEFKKGLAKNNIFDPDASALISSFVSNTSASQITEMASYWRANKLYNSKTGPTYVENTLKKFKS